MKLLKNIKAKLNVSLRRQLIVFVIIGVLVPMTIVTAVLFASARNEMKNQAVVNIDERVKTIAKSVDEMIYNIHSVSDKFAYDVEIEACVIKDYGLNKVEKKKDIYDLNSYFKKTDLLNSNEKMTAIYTRKGEIINFKDPDCDGVDVEEKLLALGAADKSTLSMFRWHPLQQDFFTNTKNYDVRQDKSVIGTRRILDPFNGGFKHIQIFSLQEEKIWKVYEESAHEMKGTVYIVDRDGFLISSSDKDTLRTGSIDPKLLNLTKISGDTGSMTTYKDTSYIMSTETLSNVDWDVISIIPVKVVTATVDKLFMNMIKVLLICVVASIAIISFISVRFLKPVDVLNTSMKEVYGGNLQSYVETANYYGELQRMMEYYNSMLHQINHFIEEKVETEKKKKQLEMEVLMGQINPHFLYNTLETIVWKSSEAGSPDIGRIAASLGRLYRLSISNGQLIVKIQQEIEHLMAYVNIQKARYKERMEFDLAVNYEAIREYSTIKLILQPVVENSFMYGMEEIDRMMRIRLKVRVLTDTIEFIIIDNGCGISKEHLENVRRQIHTGTCVEAVTSKPYRKGTGIGLYSVKERIALYFGQKDALKIWSKENFGTIVTITIPKKELKDKN